MVLCASAGLTVWAAWYSNGLAEARERDALEQVAARVKTAIHDRYTLYVQLLRGTVGLMDASEEVTREEFRTYVRALDIGVHWSGIQGVGYSVPVVSSQRAAFEESVRAEGFPEFEIRPTGERAEYSAIVFLEPMDWRNLRAFGYDMWSNSTRQVAMQRARDSGEAAMTARVTLVQETLQDRQAGFLIYIPVYRDGGDPGSVERRQQQFVGWVYAPFRASEFMREVLESVGTDVVIEVFDGDRCDPERLMFECGSVGGETDLRLASTSVDFGAVRWHARVGAPRDRGIAARPMAWGILFGGGLINGLLFAVIWALKGISRRAHRLANVMTKELQELNGALEEKVRERTADIERARERLEDAVDERTRELAAKVAELELATQVTLSREDRVIELKREINLLCEASGEAKRYAEYH